jgi:branched-chain amino acid transport system substrate-binding protein
VLSLDVHGTIVLDSGRVRCALTIVLGFLASVGAANAQISDDVVRIGVLNDQSNVYADLGGPGSVIAARMAVEDAGGKVLNKPIEILAADHQSKADVGASIARQWFDSDKVDLAIGFDNSSVALAVEHRHCRCDRHYGFYRKGVHAK